MMLMAPSYADTAAIKVGLVADQAATWNSAKCVYFRCCKQVFLKTKMKTFYPASNVSRTD